MNAPTQIIVIGLLLAAVVLAIAATYLLWISRK